MNIIITLVILFVLIYIILNRKKINIYFNNNIEEIKDLNYSNEEIKYQILKYEKLDSSELLLKIKNKNITENEFRAIKKILENRDVIIPTMNNFS